MNKKSVIIIVIIDILILAIVYGVIKHYEAEESDTTEGTGAVSQTTDEQSDTSDTDFSGTANGSDSSEQSNEDADAQSDTDCQDSDQETDTDSDSKPETIIIYSNGTQKNVSQLTSSVFYRLKIIDAAGPSQWYELDISSDAGSTWSILNADPFSGQGGAQNGIYFVNESVGFIALNQANGEEGQLYRTEDGGVTFTAVELPELTREVLAGSGEYYQPFDTPEVPYEEDGVLKLLVDQGADGDYNGGSSAMLQSDDLGQTWSYVKEVIAVEYNG